MKNYRLILVMIVSSLCSVTCLAQATNPQGAFYEGSELGKADGKAIVQQHLDSYRTNFLSGNVYEIGSGYEIPHSDQGMSQDGINSLQNHINQAFSLIQYRIANASSPYEQSYYQGYLSGYSFAVTGWY